MGCGHSRSVEEEFITNFFNSLQIKSYDPDDFSKLIVDIRTNSKSSKEAISMIQQKYFTSNITVYSKVKILEAFYEENKNKDKFLYAAILLLCKQQLLHHEKLSAGIYRVLEHFGDNLNEVFDKESRCDENLLKTIFEIYIELVTSFAVVVLAEVTDKKDDFLRKLSNPLNLNEQKIFVDNHIKVEHDKVCFKTFLYLTEEFEDSKVRDRMIELYNRKLDLDEIEKRKSDQLREMAEKKKQEAIDQANKEKKNAEEQLNKAKNDIVEEGKNKLNASSNENTTKNKSAPIEENNTKDKKDNKDKAIKK